MTDEELIAFDKRGLIPGPQETEQEFLDRVARLPDHLEANSIPIEDWREANAVTERLFAFSPDWIPAFYSNQGLRPWEGAAVWLGEFPRVQLRTAFRKGSFFKVYKREEVLAHEAVHAARIQFEEPRFEELFAYQTSTKAWRKILGPLFRTPTETLLFLLGFAFSMIGALFLSDLFVFLPFALIPLLASRLMLTYCTFSRALRRVKKIISNPGLALPFLFRLTDKEIALFAWGSEEKIHEYRINQTSLRWKLIHHLFYDSL